MKADSLKVLNGRRGREIISLLTNRSHARAFRIRDYKGPVGFGDATLQICDAGPSSRIGLNRIPWQYYELRREAETLRALDELLSRHKAIRVGPVKTLGRRRPAENHRLAEDIAEILETMPGFEIGASRRAPTTFMKVLRICFSAIGHKGSVERAAFAAARPRKPVMIDDETWSEYLNGKFKKGKKDLR